MSAAVRLILYISSKSEKPHEDHVRMAESLLALAASRCSMETASLAGSALGSVIVNNSKCDEECIQSFIRILTEDKENERRQVIVLHGILTSVKPTILMGVSNHFECAFIIWLLELILTSCEQSNTYEYHSFLLLKSWASKFLQISNQIKTETDNNFKIDIPVATLERITTICKNNAESPTKGVSELCNETLLDSYKIAIHSLSQVQADNFKNTNIQDALNKNWIQKSKYVQLKALVKCYGHEEVLSDVDGLASGLSASLTSPHLVHAGAELYGLIIRDLSFQRWRELFGPVMIQSLVSGEQGVRDACREQWLPITIKKFNSSVDFIFQETDSAQSESALTAKLSVMRICKKEGIECSSTGPDLKLIDQCLQHSSPGIKSTAFGLICNAKKKGSVPTPEELSMIRTFLRSNGADGSAKFRQNIESSFSVLCSRCRDYAAMMYRNKMKNKDAGHLDDVISFIDHCIGILVFHLLPGGNYQRKIFALDLLLVIMNSFFCFKSGEGSNKKSGNGDPSDFVKYANENGKMVIFHQQVFELLTLNLEDHMTDVKEKCYKMLSSFSPSMSACEELVGKMNQCISSPKENICETGSFIAKLLAKWGQNGLICEQLLQQLEETMSKCSKDFLVSSQQSPMFGVLIALRNCLLTSDSSEWRTFTQSKIGQLIGDLEVISDLMLSFLCGEKNELINPDFQDIAQAINDIIGDTTEDNEEDIPIPEEHQLVLSAAWHNLKECSLLAGSLVSGLDLEIKPEENSSDSISLADTVRCCELLKKITTRCRHKGVIEASNIASGLLASSLLKSDIAEFRDLPERILKDLFQQLESSWSKSSYTRRGAGLPGLIQKFVASEPSSRPRTLLPLVISRLVRIASAEAESGQEEAEDSPVSHSLHILKSLVQDAVIARDVTPYITEITSLCLETFSSHSWSVRNAGLQLLGGLTPRIVGQKKMKDDMEGYNNVNMAEIMSRFPGLIQILMAKLTQAHGSDHCLLDPCVVPILTVLARLETNTSSEFSELVLSGVLKYIDSPAHAVRTLVSKIRAQICPSGPLEVANMISGKQKECSETNKQHSELLYLLEIMKRTKLSDSLCDSLSKILSEIDKNIHCYVLKSEVSKILRLLKTSDSEPTVFSRECYTFEPGFYHWKDLNKSLSYCIPQTDEEDQLNSFEEAEDAVNQVTKSAKSFEGAIMLLEKMLNQHENTFKGALIGRILEFLLTSEVEERLNPSQNNQLFNSEESLELLDILDNETLLVLGSSIKAQVINLKAVCLNIMLIQDDWEWFFGDTSEYVSKMVELSEQILTLAASENVETCRLSAAQSLIAFLPTFKKKMITKMTLILQMGFVNLLNASLVLLQDEDPEVREAVMVFCNKLPR